MEAQTETRETAELEDDTPALYPILKTLFKDPCLVLMRGPWRSGKTDTSLLIAYFALEWGLIDKVASNIWTFNDPRVEYITSLGKLKRWLHADRSTKLFIFDEALSHVPSRTAMSHKNVGMLKLVTEISKGHGRMIFCAQTAEIDKALKNPAFMRAEFVKYAKKVMACKSTLFENQTLTDIPRSPIRFDKDVLAEFSEEEYLTYDELSIEYRVAKLYSENWSMTKIKKKEGLHQQEVKRAIQKVLKAYFESQNIKMVNRSENAPIEERTSQKD